jgi:hypothetical protein
MRIMRIGLDSKYGKSIQKRLLYSFISKQSTSTFLPHWHICRKKELSPQFTSLLSVALLIVTIGFCKKTSDSKHAAWRREIALPFWLDHRAESCHRQQIVT